MTTLRRRTRRWPLLFVAALALVGAAPPTPASAYTDRGIVQTVIDGLNGRTWNSWDLKTPAMAGDVSAVLVNGSPRVYGVDASGDLWENMWDAPTGSWKSYNLSWLMNAPDFMATSVAAIVWNGQVRIYTTARDGIVHETIPDGANGRTWNTYGVTSVSGGPRMTGELVAQVAGNVPRIVSVSVDGRPWETLIDWRNGRLWNSYPIPIQGVVGDLAFIQSAGLIRMYAVTGDGTIWEGDRNGSVTNPWNGYALTPLTGIPAQNGQLGAFDDGSKPRVYSIGRNGNLYESSPDGAGGHLWNSYTIGSSSGAPGLTSDVQAINAAGRYRVYSTSASGRVMETVADGYNGRTWNTYDLTGASAGPSPLTSLSVIKDPNGNPSVYGVYQRYASSWQYGGDDFEVNTDTEKDAVISALRARTDGADAVNFKNGLAPADQTAVYNYAKATMPSSVTYGGDNWKVDQTWEADRFITDFRGVAAEATAAGLYTALESQDRSAIDGRLATLTPMMQQGVYRDVLVGQFWEFENGTRVWVTSQEAADDYGVNLGSAVRMTTGSLAGVAVEPTSLIHETPAEIDDSEDGDVTSLLQDDDPTQATAASGSVKPGVTYKCTTDTTIRNGPNMYTLGWCPKDTALTHAAYITITAQAKNGYRNGWISGNYRNCGYINTDGHVSKKGEDDKWGHGCGVRGRYEDDFASQIIDQDCANDDQIDHRYDTSTADECPDGGWALANDQHGAAVRTTMDCPRFMNVDLKGTGPGTDPVPWSGAPVGQQKTDVLPAKTVVAWRYVTKGGRWVLAKWGSRTHPNPHHTHVWAFVEKSCFGTNEPATWQWMTKHPGAKGHENDHDVLFKVVRGPLHALSRRRTQFH